jgi:hypothetical protein
VARRPKASPPRSGNLTRNSATKLNKMFDQNTNAKKGIRVPNVTQPTLPKRPPPKPGKITSKVSFGRLYANASITDSKYAPDVSLIKIRAYSASDGFTTRTITIDGKPPRKWNQIVIAQDDLPIYRTQHIWVSCNCPRFLYFYEKSLELKGASSIRFSNGALPIQTNARLIASSCKHILTVMRYCLTKKI